MKWKTFISLIAIHHQSFLHLQQDEHDDTEIARGGRWTTAAATSDSLPGVWCWRDADDCSVDDFIDHYIFYSPFSVADEETIIFLMSTTDLLPDDFIISERVEHLA